MTQTPPQTLNLNECASSDLTWPAYAGRLPAEATGGWVCGNGAWLVLWREDAAAGTAELLLSQVGFPTSKWAGRDVPLPAAEALIGALSGLASRLSGWPGNDNNFRALWARLLPGSTPAVVASSRDLFDVAASGAEAVRAYQFAQQERFEYEQERAAAAYYDQRAAEALATQEEALRGVIAALKARFPLFTFGEVDDRSDTDTMTVDLRIPVAATTPQEDDAALDDLFAAAEALTDAAEEAGWSFWCDLDSPDFVEGSPAPDAVLVLSLGCSPYEPDDSPY
jgi:hypothetical protein